MNVLELINKLLQYRLDSIVELYDGGVAIHNVEDYDDVIDHIKDVTNEVR